jgi:hypothetical protein
VNRKRAVSCLVLVRMIVPSWPIVFYDLLSAVLIPRREQITFVLGGLLLLVQVVDLRKVNDSTSNNLKVSFQSRFSSSKREVVCGGFPHSTPNSALVFAPTRTEIIFRVLRELHRFDRKFADLFTMVFSGFSEPRVLDILYSRLALFVVAFLRGVSLLWGHGSPKK